MDPDPVALLRQLVAIPSLNPFRAEAPDARYGEGRLARFVADLLHEAGLAVELAEVAPGRPNVVAALDGPRGGPPLLFVAHLDTVPVEGMSVEPFAATVRGGRLTGRGACDTKSSLAAMLAALCRVARDRANPRPLLFAGTVDEESGFRGIRAFLAGGPAARAAVVGEPTALGVVVAHRGVARYTVVTHGTSAHSATPEQGVNAIYRMAPIVLELETLAAELARREPHPLTGPPSLSVGTIHGGLSVNTVPDRCAVEVDRRLVPSETLEVAEAAVRAIAEQRGASVEPLFGASAFEVPRDAALVRRATAAVRAVTGQGAVRGARYATEAAELAEAGIPAVVLGPGDPAQAHSADEWVDLAQVEAACAVYTRLMTGEEE